LERKTVTTDVNPRLCGGTFFVLVLQALKQRVKARQHYNGERDGLSDPEVLIGLIKVINPDYQEPREGALKGKTNDFKSCKTSTGQYLPFGNTAEIETFDERVRERYPDAFYAMSVFVNEFLETGTEVQKDVRLVKALIDLIQQDDSIRPDEEFYIEEQGGKIKKTALGGLDDICLPAFLLGIWHYVVVYRKDNRVGENTYDKWCPKNGGAPRTYSGNMGKRITKNITVHTPAPSEPDEDDLFDFGDLDEDRVGDRSEKDYDFDFGDEDSKTGSMPPTQQIINNPLFISQTGDNSTVIPNYGTINLDLGKRGGGSNE
jgi:hypothetical protein